MSSYIKKLNFESNNILKEHQSKDFLELQNKFDKLYLNLSNELKAIEIVIQEIKLKKEIFIKHMGEDSGFKGIMWAFILGTIGAGPTYGAFPVAALLIKKGARIAYAIFFLGIWSAVKLPLVIFESTAMGIKFTTIHIVIMVLTYLLGSFAIEKLLSKESKDELIENAKRITE